VARVNLRDSPGAVCLSPNQNRLYCGLYVDSVVAAIDCSADTLLGYVPVGIWPHSICYGPHADKVYCGTYSGEDVTVIDCASDSALATLDFPSIPWSICADPASGNVYCTSRLTRQVLILDGAGDSVLAAVDVGEVPGTAYWSAGRHRAYIANENGHSISVLRDSPGGIEETVNDERRKMNVTPTIVRGVLRLRDCQPVSVGETGGCAQPVLFDATGRKVMDLAPGANDVSRLAPGIYFVRPASGVGREASSVRKVVVTR